MVAPLVAAAGIAAVSGIVQAWQGEKARGANEKRLKEIEALFRSIVPPEYDVSINDPPEYLEGALQQANLDFSRITPEQFKMVGQYSPQAAQFVAEQNPQLLKGSANQKEGRQAQLDALRQIQSTAKGNSPELAIKLQQARDSAQTAAQSRQQSILDDAQRRGQGGSGVALLAQLQGAGDSMAQGAAQSQNAALQQWQAQQQAIQQSGQMGRQLSQDELAMEGQNNDIINSFNERTSRQYQDYLNQRAAMQNQAQIQNLNAQQDISNRNTASANEAARFNLTNKNQLAQQAYGNTRDERNYQNSIAEQKAQWAAQEKARQNQLKSQAYGDKMTQAQGMAGIASSQNQNTTQNAQDRNNIIGAAAGAGAGYFNQQAEDERWDKYFNSRYGA